MVQFILTNTLMISAGCLLYLIARTLPRIGEEHSVRRHTIIDRWMMSTIPERLDALFLAAAIKTLRKLKVVLLKIDNVITVQLKYLKPAARSKRSIVYEVAEE